MKVCAKCFNDLELHSYINSLANGVEKCNYCQNISPQIEIEELLDFFSELLSTFKKTENGIPLTKIVQYDWNLFSREDVATKIIDDLLPLLKDPFENSNILVNHISEIEDNIIYWKTLKDNLKWERRYLVEIDNLKELGWDSLFNKQTLLTKKDILYRARIHQTANQKCYSVREMGCPNKIYANSGRANPLGIPFLYLSKSPETTLYETRALNHDEISVGKFKLKDSTELRLVDFTEQPSAFKGVGELKNYSKEVFLKKLISFDLSKPIRRYDSEIEYIPTQFICEFVRYFIGADGILFNSSLHKGGKNIVLFDEGKVKCISVKKYSITDVNLSY